MENGVLDAADVLIHRQPVVHAVAAEGGVGPGRAEAGEVPGRFEEGIEGIGLASGRFAAGGAIHLSPRGMVLQRVARRLQVGVLGEADRKVRHGDGNDAAVGTVNHRDRAPPVALSGHAPVAQTVVHRPLSGAGGVQAVRHLGLGLLDAQSVQEIRIDDGPVIQISLVADGVGGPIGVRRENDGNDVEAVLAGKFQVALVVGRTAEDGAGAVFHEHEIGDEDRELAPPGKGMQGAEAGVVPLLVGGFDGGFAGAEPVAFGDEGGQVRVPFGQLQGQRVIGGDGAERGAEDSVGARRVHFQAVAASFQGEEHAQSLRTADPFFLHQPHPFGPPLERLQRLQEIVGECGDAQEPLGQLPLLHGRPGPPSPAVYHLFVGQNRLLHRVPVDPGFLAVGQTAFEEIQEHLLFVTVVFGIARGHLARPVVGQAHGLELFAHGVDVVVRPRRRVDLVLSGRILRRQAEGVPAHGMKHVEPAGALVAGDKVAKGVVAHVPHVDAARRIGEHFKNIVLGTVPVLGRGEAAALLPDRLPLDLGFLEVVPLHGALIVSVGP